MLNESFVHLRVHSEYSLVDGLVRVKDLCKHTAALGMPAVALTDLCNFYALIKFQKAAQGAGIKPIYGSDLLLREDDDPEQISTLCLLVQNETGYHNLTDLISRAYLEGQWQGKAYVYRSWVEQQSEGLIALSAGRDGDVGQLLVSGKRELAEARLSRWLSVFGDRFYLELQRTGRPYEEDYIHDAVALAAKLSCPVVATNDVRFIHSDEFEAHEARVCIRDGRVLDDPRRPRNYSDQQYLRSTEEMLELFSDIPEALENSVEIARRCNLTVKLGTYYLPEYPIPEGMTQEQFFRELCHKGLDERLDFLFDRAAPSFADTEKEYRARLDFELDIILQMGFPGYFLIVMDFIQWAKDHDIPVGPGRGSGAGSLVAYALKITDLDPIEYDLLFERFLNPERVSMPDFDVDFCMDGRDQVISYVADNYGRDAVSQIITFGTMAAKAVVRDVARVQGKSYGLADKLSKLIPFEVGMTLSKALEQEPALKEFLEADEQAQEIWDMAEQLEGVVRGVGKHAGGVVIAPSKLTDFAPLFCDETGSGLVTQFDKNDVEDAGLVKFDFLGLRTLTIIDWALKIVNAQRAKVSEDPLDIMAIPLEDKKTFDLLKSAETTAVFQLESRGMKELIKKLLPDCFEDIVALVALFRPGPLQSGMVDDFINRKHGRAELAFPHPQYQHECLQPILQPTYGIILYQEQVMQIAQEMSGYSLGGADLLRRAMGKKKPEEMAKQRSTFEDGAKNNNIDPDLAMKIFDLVEKFAGYGFNKSHSAAYALVSYQTLWLKVHYPAEFMAAVMSADMDNTDKIVTLVDEVGRMEMEILPPDLNKGRYKFTVDAEGRIVYGIGAIKGVGEGPIEAIIEARETHGAFTDLFDFCAKVDLKRVNKRVLEKLVLSGAMDNLGPHRAALMATLPEAIAAADQHAKAESFGQSDMFGLLTTEPEQVEQAFADVPKWPEKVWLEGEKETLGLYLTGHPINQYADEIRNYIDGRLVDLRPTGKDQMSTAVGLVLGVRVMTNKKGRRWAIVTLDDKSARMDVRFFPDMYEQFESILESDRILLIKGQVSFDDFSGGNTITARDAMDIVQAREKNARALALQVDTQWCKPDKLASLQSILQSYSGGSCPVQLDILHPDVAVSLKCGAHWYITPEDQLLHELKQCLGEQAVKLAFH